eukprot:13351881-Alexandrium_andersonii.AAC.1
MRVSSMCGKAALSSWPGWRAWGALSLGRRRPGPGGGRLLGDPRSSCTESHHGQAALSSWR